MTNSPKWFNYVNAILDTIGTGEFTTLQDKITYQVMVKVVPGLMNKKGIDGSLLHGFITNIRSRVGERDFDFKGPLVLTRNQRTHAKNMGWDNIATLDELIEKNADWKRIGSGLEADWNSRHEANQQFVRILSALYPRAIRDVSAKMDPNHLENCDFLSAMKCNEMKRNHEDDMIPAHAGITTSSGPGDVSDYSHELTDSPHNSGHEGEKIRQSSSARPRPKPSTWQISLWVKERKGAVGVSGNLETGDQKYHVVFSTFDNAVERLNMEDVDNAEFRKMLNQEIYPLYRNTNPGCDVRDTAHLSPVFNTGDTNGFKDPAASEVVVALDWSADNQPVGAWFINSDKKTYASLTRFKSGVYKGSFA